MESVGKKRARPRRSFTPEFKAEIVELCRRGDRTVRQVSRRRRSQEGAHPGRGR
jgi:transposase